MNNHPTREERIKKKRRRAQAQRRAAERGNNLPTLEDCRSDDLSFIKSTN